MSTTVIESTPVIPTETILSETSTSKEPETKPPETVVAPEKKAETKEKPASLFDGLKVVTPHTPEEPVKAEPKKDEKPPEAKTEEKVKSPNHDHFKRLEEAKKLAVEQAEAQKKENAELRKQIEEAKQQALAESEAIRTENAKIKGDLRVAAIERDPEFQEKYVKAEARRSGELKELAVAAGYTEKQFEAAYARGDEETLSEIEGALDPAQKRKWNNHLLKIEEIRDEKKQAIADSEKTWQELQNKHKQTHTDQVKEVLAKNTAAAEAAIEEIRQMAPGIDTDTELLESVREMLLDVSGATENSAKWTTQEILKNIAYAQIQSKIIIGQGKALEDAVSENKELKEKLAEAEAFVTGHTASAPRGGNGASAKPVVEEGSMLGRLDVRIPGR